MRPSVSQAERIGLSHGAPRSVYANTRTNITRHSVNPQPVRPTNLNATQNVTIRRHTPVRASLQAGAQTLPRGSHLPHTEAHSPADNTGRETEPATRRIMHSETLDRLSGGTRPRLAPRPTPVAAPAPPRRRVVAIQQPRRPAPTAGTLTENSLGRPRPEPREPIPRPPPEQPAETHRPSPPPPSQPRVDVVTEAFDLPPLEILGPLIQGLPPQVVPSEIELMFILLQLQRLEAAQLELALELSRREAEPRPEPPKKVDMKEHVVSRAECSDGTECSICLCEFQYHEKDVISLKCGHVFHKECVSKWFEAHHTCPTCRMDIDEG